MGFIGSYLGTKAAQAGHKKRKPADPLAMEIEAWLTWIAIIALLIHHFFF